MEIKEFVKNVLSEITEATDGASNDKYKFVLADRDGKGVFFDMAVTVSNTDSKTKGGKGGIKVASVIEAGGAAGSNKTVARENTTRVQFNVGYRDLVEEQEWANLSRNQNNSFDTEY